MVITGIRHKIRSEADERQSASFTKFLMHYLRMFAILGVMFPCLIGIDYALKQKTMEDTVTNKFYKVTGNINGTEYHIYTGSYHFISNQIFFDQINKGDNLTYFYTPVFRTITDVSYQVGQNVYQCMPAGIYGWPIIVAALTLLCSTILLIKTRTGKSYNVSKFDSMVNLGIVNAFMCVFVLIAVLFHITN